MQVDVRTKCGSSLFSVLLQLIHKVANVLLLNFATNDVNGVGLHDFIFSVWKEKTW